jgi:uncharacterized protein (TIGR02145 family)
MKNKLFYLNFYLTVFVMFLSCNNSSKDGSKSIENSLESKIQNPEHVTIGNQLWSTKNLNVDKFRNGDIITQAKTVEEWKAADSLKIPAWCYYNNDSKNGNNNFGKLYNWHAVNDQRGLAPEGYSIPTLDDWTSLAIQLKNNVGKQLKSDKYFHGTGDNSSGFDALPGGKRVTRGRFDHLNNVGYWWSSTESGENFAKLVYLSYTNDKLISPNIGEEMLKGLGVSVRCIKIPSIESKYIGKWSNDNTELFYISFGHIEITNKTITYYSGEFAEYLNFKIEGDKILLFYNGIEGSLNWNSNKTEDAKPKCKTQIGYLTKEGNSIVLYIQNDVCGKLPNGKHILVKHKE